ncbi:hypothetical protein AOR13_3407 [Alteromonas stellipolaris LMG 21856]|nr:hypothetical protein AOR13_3407 [Alteromonas stellipolaris LMG 21856]
MPSSYWLKVNAFKLMRLGVKTTTFAGLSVVISWILRHCLVVML